MRQHFPAIAFILTVFGLLVLNRVSVRPQVEVRVTRSTGSTHVIGQTVRGGETVNTSKGEFVSLSIGEFVRVDLDENTTLKLSSLSADTVRIGFGHGRILVDVDKQARSPLSIHTPTAVHEVTGRATFIGYDFKRETSVIPLSGSIRTTIPLLDQTITLTNPITIQDVNPPTIRNITFDEKTDARKAFYLWTEGE